MPILKNAKFFLIIFFSLFFCSLEHFSIFFVLYLGVTAAIEPAIQQYIPGALADICLLTGIDKISSHARTPAGAGGPGGGETTYIHN